MIQTLRLRGAGWGFFCLRYDSHKHTIKTTTFIMYHNGNEVQRHTWRDMQTDGRAKADRRMNDGQTKQRVPCNVRHPLPSKLMHTHTQTQQQIQ